MQVSCCRRRLLFNKLHTPKPAITLPRQENLFTSLDMIQCSNCPGNSDFLRVLGSQRHLAPLWRRVVPPLQPTQDRSLGMLPRGVQLLVCNHPEHRPNTGTTYQLRVESSWNDTILPCQHGGGLKAKATGPPPLPAKVANPSILQKLSHPVDNLRSDSPMVINMLHSCGGEYQYPYLF